MNTLPNRSVAVLLTVLLFSTSWVGAQTKAQLNNAYNAGNWKEFVAAVEDLRENDPDAMPPVLWFRLGVAQLNLKNYEAALDAFGTAADAGFNPGFVALREASVYAEQGNKDAAFAALGRVVDSGFNNSMVLENDARLRVLHGDARYQAVLDKLQAAHPCSRPECRQFDFWVGDWDVHGPNGNKAGTNSIHPILNQCALQENWRNVGGSGGQSVNFFHPGKKKWVQVWVSPNGGIIEIEGEYRDAAMHFTGRNIAVDGTYELCRASWTLLDDGRVRQFWEQSKDEGDTWYTWFDGYYSRRED